MPRFTRFVCVMLAAMLITPALAQHVPSKERVDPTLRRQTDIDGNNIRATIFNSGLTGRTGSVPNAVPYEWPKNSSCTYIALTGMFYGALVEDMNGEEQKIVDIVQFRSSPSGESWSHEPIPGYNNPDYRNAIQTLGIAKSTDPQSWPQDGWADKFGDETDPGWVGSWNGFFGKDIFNADQELFFKMGDDNYDRWLGTFQPDATDPTRGGLALVTEMRVMAWSQILVNDVIYLIHNIQNDGTTDYERMAFTIWLADLVGGDGDAQDDLIGFSLTNDIAFFRDSDGIGCGGRRIGAGGVSFLETPGIAIDRIDNDGDGEVGPVITEELLAGEDQTNLIDDNGNGLIDENPTHIPFIGQTGVGYADRIDNDGDGEPGSPLVTQEMVNDAVGDPWHRWPPDPESDAFQDGDIHLIMVENDDVLAAFADNIDNDGDGEDSSSVITQAIVDAAAADPYKRYRVPGTDIILYDVGPEDLGMAYADGIDNDGDNAIDEGIDTGIDEMIEESREDHIDNDGDWDIFNDDVGLDGVANTGDTGENDGVPTSGAGTPFPGEPNLDKTDISESDQLGITNVQWEPAGSIDFNVRPDLFFWNAFMVPGQFVLPTAIPGSDRDLFVSSGLFPLNSGSIGRISYAVIMGEDTLDVLLNRERAQETYNADYQFAKAPLVPTLSAVPGNNQVTLYWDDVAEESFDTFMDKLGQPAKDFEGYRLYRAQDPAFEDIFTITDGNGTRTFLEPIQQWDLVDEWTGFHPIDVNGIKFKLGDNTGLVHSYVDRDVINGKTYYYALTSFDFGNPGFNISPSESPILITIDALGKADLGKNVLEIVPAAPVAGYRPPEIGDLNHVAGGATGELRFTVVDPRLIKDNHTYRVTFEDTLIEAPDGSTTQRDTIKTRNFSLVDVTDQRVLVDRNEQVGAGKETPLTDGFRIEFLNEENLEQDVENSQWSDSSIYSYSFREFAFLNLEGTPNPADYRIEFGDVGIARSDSFLLNPSAFPPPLWIQLEPKDVNFKITNTTENKEIKFALWELDGDDGRFTGRPAETDIIIFLEENRSGELIATWQFSYQTTTQFADPNRRFPVNGEFVELRLFKPFLELDIFEFTTTAEAINQQEAIAGLENVRVVPNPYVAASTFETRNPFERGRGPRRIHFINLPQVCTIRIFTVSGELVDIIEHNSSLQDGTAEWDLQTRENLSVSYGVYIYHLEAPGVGEKIDKFAIIK